MTPYTTPYALFDESGHARDPNIRVVTLAGAMASAERWDALQPKWRAALCDFGVPQVHMRHFAHSVDEYAKWKNNEPRRREFLARFTDLTMEAAWSIYGASVDLDALRKIEAEHGKTVDAYYICLQRIIWDSALESTLYADAGPVQVIAAQHPEFTPKAGLLYDICWRTLPGELRDRLSPVLGISTPTSLLQLQASDLIAHEMNRVVSDGLHRPDNQTRWPMLKLLTHPMTRVTVFDESRLREMFPAC